MKEKLFCGSKKYYINSAITIVLMFGFRFLPPIGTISQVGMGVLGVFLGAIYGWSTVGIFWPSALSIIALSFTGYGKFSELISTGMGSNTFIVLVTMFGLLAIINESGISMYLAKKIIGLKIGRGRPWVVVYLLMTACSLLFGVTGAFPIALMIWEIFYDMVDYNGIQKGKFTQFVVTAVMFGAILGGQIFPFTVVILVLFNIFTSTTGLAAPAFVSYVIWMLVISQLCTIVFIRKISAADQSSEAGNQKGRNFGKTGHVPENRSRRGCRIRSSSGSLQYSSVRLDIYPGSQRAGRQRGCAGGGYFPDCRSFHPGKNIPGLYVQIRRLGSSVHVHADHSDFLRSHQCGHRNQRLGM